MSKALPDTTSHPITAKILEQVKAIDISLPESVDDKWREIEQKEITLAVHIAELGYRYMDLREAVGHGEFIKSLEQRGIERRKVNRYINIAKFFMEAPEANGIALSHLKPTQISILTKLPEEQKQALTPEKIEEYAPMSTRALEAEVKQLRLAFDEQDNLANENHRLKAQLKASQRDYANKVTELNHEQLIKTPEKLFGLHVEVANTRQRAMVTGELLATVTAEINHLVQHCTNSGLAPELSRDCALAINTSVSGQIMQLANSLTALHASFDKTVLTTPDNLPVYSAIEVNEALSNADSAKGDFLATIGAL